MAKRPEVVILGGGVIGLTTAYFLAKEGTSVLLLDKGDLGREASWAGAGILPPGPTADATTPFDRLRALSNELFPALSDELRESTGIDNGYRVCGGLEFFETDDDSPTPPLDEWHGPGSRVDRVGPEIYRGMEPALAGNLGPAQHLPDLAQLRNPRHLQALITACARIRDAAGTPLVELCPHTTAYALLRDGDRIDAVYTPQGMIEGEKYLIAAGAWTDGLLRPLGWSLPIEPVRGQIVLLHPGMPVIEQVLMMGSRYLVPRLEGRILVGSTEEYAGFDKRVTASGVRGLIEFATRLAPELAGATVERTWSGLRPGNRAGLPYMGRLGDCANLFLCAGHFRAGLHLSPASALLMKQLLLGLPTTIGLEPFAPPVPRTQAAVTPSAAAP